MGVGSGIGVDLVESESIPKKLDFSLAFPQDQPNSDPIIIKELTCG